METDNDEKCTLPIDPRSQREALLSTIVGLKTGEALIFSPSALIAMEHLSRGRYEPRALGAAYMKVKIRARLTADGGTSTLAR